MTDLVIVATFATRAEAEMAANRLAQEGIRSVVGVDDAGGLRPEVAFSTGGARLRVSPDDAARARDILGVSVNETPPRRDLKRPGCLTWLGVSLAAIVIVSLGVWPSGVEAVLVAVAGVSGLVALGLGLRSP